MKYNIVLQILLIILFINYLWIKKLNISFANTYLYQFTPNMYNYVEIIIFSF